MSKKLAPLVDRLLTAYRSALSNIAELERKLAEAMQQPPVTDPSELKQQQERAEQAEAKVAALEATLQEKEAQITELKTQAQQEDQEDDELSSAILAELPE